jgi:hypothetical protein
MKRFRLQTETGEDVLGGEVGEDNVYISTYGTLEPGSSPPGELLVDEFCKKRYALSGQKPTVYVIVRTS